jgi:osmotically-inducible protein OsmY
MTHRTRTTINVVALAIASFTLLGTVGCAVTRNQETVGAYVDDTGITTAVKARLIDNHDVDGTSIRVETLNGTVMLSGFAKSITERTTAEALAWKVNGVKSVKNEIAIRP